MLKKINHSVSDSSLFGFQYVKPHHRSPRNIILFISSRQKQEFPPLISYYYTGFHKFGNNRRKYMVYSVEPGASPSGPPLNVLSWIVAVAIAIAVPFINHKWGPLLKKKIEGAMQTTEDVVEAVEKVAETVEKLAEDIADDLPDGGELRKAVDYVENFAERAAKDAGAIDELIDKVQELEEEKAKLLAESQGEDESKKLPPPNDTKEVKSLVDAQGEDESKKPSPNDTNLQSNGQN